MVALTVQGTGTTHGKEDIVMLVVAKVGIFRISEQHEVGLDTTKERSGTARMVGNSFNVAVSVAFNGSFITKDAVVPVG